MSPEFIAILSIGATLAGTQLAAVLWLAGYVRGEIGGVRVEVAAVRAQVADEARGLREEMGVGRTEAATEVGSLREEIGGVRVEVAAVRAQVADEARGLREEMVSAGPKQPPRSEACARRWAVSVPRSTRAPTSSAAKSATSVVRRPNCLNGWQR